MSAMSQTQFAIQLVGADQLQLNTEKPVIQPGPHQYLAKVCCVGLCYSDMKLLAQFDQHVRKTPVLDGLAEDILSQIPSYVPNNDATVPGHEVVVEVVELGEGVSSVETGKRYMVQADWRDLKTANSNGAFGYNFEGALQQFVLLDERCTVAKSGESYLLEIDPERGTSANALVEPWACVEDAFIHHERTNLTESGTLLVIADGSVIAELDGVDVDRAATRWFYSPEESVQTPEGFERLESVCLLSALSMTCCLPHLMPTYSSHVRLVSLIMVLLQSLLVVVSSLREVELPVGRVHYGNCRVVGYSGTSFARCLERIPATGELRPGDHLYVVGAGGPMGVMATIRALSSGIEGVSVSGSNRNADRLAALAQRAQPTADRLGVSLIYLIRANAVLLRELITTLSMLRFQHWCKKR